MLADTSMELFGKWRLRPASHRTLLVFSEALICLSYTAVVPPRGFAPRSIGYRPIALLLSYGGWLENGRAPRCCPGCLLAPNEAGLLTPSRAISERWLLRLAAGRAGGVSPNTVILAIKSKKNSTADEQDERR
jgi:hypothetical protein